MTPLTRADLRSLGGTQPGWCVTIHLPTHRAGKDTEQDPIRLKHLLGEAAPLAAIYRY